MGRAWKVVSGVIVLVVALAVGSVSVLRSTDLNSYRGLLAEQVKAFTGRELSISGNIKLRISLNPVLSVEGITLANAGWGTRSEMVKLKLMEAEVELLPLLSGQVKIKRIVLIGLDALLETDYKGQENWLFSNKSTAIKTGNEQKSGGDGIVPVVNMVEIVDAKFTYLDRVSARLMVVMVKDMKLASDGLNSPLELDIKGAYNDLPFTASARLGSLNEFLDGAGPFPVSARVNALGASVNIEGTIKYPRQISGMNLRLAFNLPDIATFAGAFGIAMNDLPSLNVTTNLADIPGGYVLDTLKLVIGNSDLSGSASILLDRRRPYADLRLTSDRIDLDQLLDRAPVAGKADKKDDGRIFSGDPLAFDILDELDAKISFIGRRIDIMGTRIKNVSTRIVIKDRRLDISSLRAVLGKGTINANIILDGAGKRPEVALELDVVKLDYGILMDKISVEDIINGKVDIKVNVKGTGKSVRDIMASLGGRFRVAIKGGMVESEMLNILYADALSFMPLVDSNSDKYIRCAVADFDISSGLAKSRAIVLETGGLLMTGKGSANLADETLDLKIDPSARKVSLIKLAMVPVNVGGTFALPVVTLDVGAAAVGVVAGAVSMGTGIVTGVVNVIGSAISGGWGSGNMEITDYCKLAMAGKPMVRNLTPGTSPLQRLDAIPRSRKKDKNIIESIGGGISGMLKGLLGQ